MKIGYGEHLYGTNISQYVDLFTLRHTSVKTFKWDGHAGNQEKEVGLAVSTWERAVSRLLFVNIILNLQCTLVGKV